MLHPLLPFRLFIRPSAPLTRPPPKPHHPVRDWMTRAITRGYRRWGVPLGFLLGLYLSVMTLGPIALRG
jgi:hypothetical protein